MIRPDTPPGTEVICIDAAAGPYGDGGLRRGEIYTIERIAPAVEGGHVALLAEIKSWETYAPPWGLVEIGFELSRFRYLDIPRSLTALLAQTPAELERVE